MAKFQLDGMSNPDRAALIAAFQSFMTVSKAINDEGQMLPMMVNIEMPAAAEGEAEDVINFWELASHAYGRQAEHYREAASHLAAIAEAIGRSFP